MKRKAVHKLAQKWLTKLHIPPNQLKVAVGDKEWREAGNRWPLANYNGRVMDNGTGFGIAQYQKRTTKQIANTIVHEIVHILWPNKPHWWAECFAQKLTGGGPKWTGRYSYRYGHSINDLPSRAKCIKLAQNRARKLWPMENKS